VNAIALVEGVPRTLSLRDFIRHYLDHQRDVIRRRSRFRLERAETRAHVLEGLLIALKDIDAVIALIRRAADPEEARNGLMGEFSLTELQARAILDLRLQRLTQLEAGKIQAEYDELQAEIAELRAILGDEARVYQVIRDELSEVRPTMMCSVPRIFEKVHAKVVSGFVARGGAESQLAHEPPAR
jgi:DNA gyrase subunit A